MYYHKIIRIYVKCWLFSSDFSKTWMLSRHFRKKSSNIKFHENPSSKSRVVPSKQNDGPRQTDRQTDRLLEILRTPLNPRCLPLTINGIPHRQTRFLVKLTLSCLPFNPTVYSLVHKSLHDAMNNNKYKFNRFPSHVNLINALNSSAWCIYHKV